MPEFSLLLGGDTGCALLFDDSDPPSAIALAKKLFPEVRVFKNIYEMYPGEDNRRLIDATKQSLNGS